MSLLCLKRNCINYRSKLTTSNYSYKYCDEHRKLQDSSKICLYFQCIKQGNNKLFLSRINMYFCDEHFDFALCGTAQYKCTALHCKEEAKYGVLTSVIPKYCITHKTDLMNSITNIVRCAHVPCTRRANFKHPDASMATKCGKHKTIGMIDIRFYNKVPTVDDGASTFNDDTSTKKNIYEHTVINQCFMPGCCEQATYNFKNTERPFYCAKHAYPSMEIII